MFTIFSWYRIWNFAAIHPCGKTAGSSCRQLKEVSNPPISRSIYKHIQRIRENQDGKLKHFFLPDIPGGEGDIKTIREGYDQRSEYLKSNKRIFLKIGQGEMWLFPKSENPYFQISLSECSAIVGTNEKNIVAAHISYSAIDQIQAVVTFMKNMGINLENIYVIASVGDFQKKRSEEEHRKRAFDSRVYIKMGIPESNISQFEFKSTKTKGDEGWLQKNLTQVVGCKDALFKYSFDLISTLSSSTRLLQEEKIGNYKDEEIIKI